MESLAADSLGSLNRYRLPSRQQDKEDIIKCTVKNCTVLFSPNAMNAQSNDEPKPYMEGITPVGDLTMCPCHRGLELECPRVDDCHNAYVNIEAQSFFAKYATSRRPFYTFRVKCVNCRNGTKGQYARKKNHGPPRYEIPPPIESLIKCSSNTCELWWSRQLVTEYTHKRHVDAAVWKGLCPRCAGMEVTCYGENCAKTELGWSTFPAQDACVAPEVNDFGSFWPACKECR